MTTRQLDSVDRHLIALLESNARESVTNIAKALGVARTTVNERMARLERDGTIRGYTVMLNRNPFEEYVQCYLLLEIERRTQNTTINFLKRFPEIKLCQVVTGECDLVCSCEVAHLEDLETLMVEVASGTGIRSIRSIVAMTTRIDRRGAVSALQSFPGAAGISRGEAG